MAVFSHIKDPRNSNAAHISTDGAIKVALDSQLAVSSDVQTAPFSRLLSIGGDGVTTQLNVNGSTTPREAFVTGEEDGDTFLTSMSIVIGDSALALNKFGDLPRLTNGVEIFYGILRGEVTVPVKLRTAFDIIRLSDSVPAIGSRVDAFQLSKVDSGGNDGYMIPIDLKRFSPLDFGIRLRRESNDKFGLRIRDNLTGLSFFNVLVSGFTQFTDFDLNPNKTAV